MCCRSSCTETPLSLLTNKFYKLWNTTPEVFTPFVGKGSCLRPDMKDYITHADVED